MRILLWQLNPLCLLWLCAAAVARALPCDLPPLPSLLFESRANRAEPGDGIYDVYVGKDVARQPLLRQTRPVEIHPIRRAKGFENSYVDVFMQGRKVDGREILGELRMLEALIRLLDDARAVGFISQGVQSAYRSFEEQASLNAELYDQEPERFVAAAGRSEHQLGTAVDLSWAAGPFNLETMARDSIAEQFYAWLKLHAHEYGFVISYPLKSDETGERDNRLGGWLTEYKAEPWHLRFVEPEFAFRVFECRDQNGWNYLNPLSRIVPEQFFRPR